MHQIVEKKWGREKIIVNADYCGKVMTLKPGFKCSIHRHAKKDETFWVMAGSMALRVNNDPPITLSEGQSYRIHPGTWHSFANHSEHHCVFIEFSTHDDPSDSERLTESGPI